MISQASIKGLQGEAMVQLRLEELKRVYSLEYVYNFPIEKADGTYQQCDFVVLAQQGFYALEIKNWSGYLKCDGCDRAWRFVSESGRSIRVLSPVMQNTSHVRWIRESYGIPCSSVVLFADTCELINPFEGVLNFRDTELLFKGKPIIHSTEEVKLAYERLRKIKAQNELQAIAERYVRRLNDR